ncbi:MAG TPA: hypothetical protein PKW35_18320 [Nannocystaceae bacterium]|nr:hypothetical protein [Nannocystaceae bacterium]
MTMHRCAPLLLLTALPLACGGDDGTSTGASSSASTTGATSATTSGGTADTGTSDGSTSGSGSDGSTSSSSGDATESGSSTGTSDASTTSTSTSTSSTTGTSDATTTTGGVDAIPVHDIPGLLSITFWERSGGNAPTPYTFDVWGPELTNILPDPLTDQSNDIKGVTTEFYDVYYSDIDGNFDADGSYLTIAGSFGYTLPAGGGLNLAEIALNYQDNSVEYGSYVASYVALGDNAAPDSAPKSIDGDLQTHTTMGNNVLEPDKRLRVTLGFMSSLMPG